MGKTKELFMQISNRDLEREYLIDKSIKDAYEEEEYEKLKIELNSTTTKIEVKDGDTTRIQVSEEVKEYNQHLEVFEDGF
jgi:hypothetical protein